MFNLNAILNDKAYVLTENQLLEATLRGALEMGLVQSTPEVESALFRLKTSTYSCDAYDFTVTANGAVLTFGLGPELEKKVDEAVARSAEAGPLDVEKFLAENQPVPVDKAPDDGPSPEEVKGLLARAMERAPSVTTVRSWDVKQRKSAKTWARKVIRTKAEAEKSGVVAPLPARPDFIVEPAPRQSSAGKAFEAAAAPSTPVEKPRRGRAPAETPPPNGSAEQRSKFWDEDDEEESRAGSPREDLDE